MIELRGKHNTAKVFTDNIEQTAVGQIIELCNQEFAKDSNIRIMPDTHAGSGCTIGTTMTIHGKIVPNLVGVDIGCGMLCTEIKPTNIDFSKLDQVIYDYVPFGGEHRTKPHRFLKKVRMKEVLAPYHDEKVSLSLGTLGGGNHFIEMNQSEDGRIYLVIHSGSRHLGVKVATHYQKLAAKYHRKKEYQMLIDFYKGAGRERELESAIKSYRYKPAFPDELAYVEGALMDDYLHDLKIAQEFAYWNRQAMMDEIVTHMGFDVVDSFDTIHNYIDIENMILRKGAISAQAGERILIPINMRDGSIIATGKGNPEWNYSAPHGAGRLMSRSTAKANLSINEFQETMKKVWSTSVVPETLDESPMAYKSMDEIIENTKDTLTIQSVIKPLYNFKAH